MGSGLSLGGELNGGVQTVELGLVVLFGGGLIGVELGHEVGDIASKVNEQVDDLDEGVLVDEVLFAHDLDNGHQERSVSVVASLLAGEGVEALLESGLDAVEGLVVGLDEAGDIAGGLEASEEGEGLIDGVDTGVGVFDVGGVGVDSVGSGLVQVEDGLVVGGGVFLGLGDLVLIEGLVISQVGEELVGGNDVGVGGVSVVLIVNDEVIMDDFGISVGLLGGGELVLEGVSQGVEGVE